MAGKINTQLIIEGKNKAGAAFKQADSQLSQLGASAKKAGAFIAAALSVGALSSFVKTSIDAADAASKSAQAVGLAVEEYTALSYAAELAGVGASELDAGLSRLNRTIYAAVTGGSAQAEAFDRIGVAVLDAGGKLKTSDQILAEIADRFQSMPDGIQKSALAMELFGKSGARMIPLLNGGSAGLAELRKEAEALGLVISGTSAAQAEVFNDNLTRLGKVAEGAGNQIAADLLPSLADLTDLMVEVNKEGAATNVLAGVLGGGLKILATVVLIAANAFGSLGRFIGASAAAAVSAAKGDFSGAAEIMRSVGAENAKAQGEVIKRVKDLWSGAGEAAAAAAVEQKKQQQIMAGDLKRTTDEMAVQLKRQVSDAQSAVKARVKAERDAARDLEAAKKAQLDTEKRYSEALAKLRSGGAGDPSFGQFNALKVAARQDLQNGNIDGAKEKAQAALEVLNQLAAAGENAYGFEGFIKELQGIEQSADQINVDNAQKSFDEAAAQAAKLKVILDDLKAVKLSVDLPQEEIERIKGVMQQLATELGQAMVITPKIALPKVGEADSEGYVFVGNNPSVPKFATGGRVRGAGTGTSDSITARLSNGEYVMRAAAVAKFGPSFFDQLNNGLRLPAFADGGLVSAAMSAPASPSFPHLGRLDINAGGQTIPAYVDLDFAKQLSRTATKFGRTHK